MGLKALANSGYTIAVEVMMVGVCLCWGEGALEQIKAGKSQDRRVDIDDGQLFPHWSTAS